MFHIFKKKEFLVDHLHGLVDIHNHILPGIDDGAKTVDDSLELLKGFSEFGVTNFICTPHVMHNYYDNTTTSIKNSFDRLSEKLDHYESLNVTLDYSAEHMIDDNFENILEKGKVLPLRKDYLLVEMSYLQPSINFEIAIEKIQKKQFHPVLAHPERYLYFQRELGKFEFIKSKEIRFQLNLLSLTGYYGNGIQKVAFKLLNQGFYDFIASDVHHIRHIKNLKENKISKQVAKLIEPVILNTIEEFY